MVAYRTVREGRASAMPQPPAAACRQHCSDRDTRAVCFPRRVAELLRRGLDLRDRHATGEISRHGLAVACGRLENQLSDLIFPPKTNASNETLAQLLRKHRDELFTFCVSRGWTPPTGGPSWRSAS